MVIPASFDLRSVSGATRKMSNFVRDYFIWKVPIATQDSVSQELVSSQFLAMLFPLASHQAIASESWNIYVNIDTATMKPIANHDALGEGATGRRDVLHQIPRYLRDVVS
jgi:hypothetical protein